MRTISLFVALLAFYLLLSWHVDVRSTGDLYLMASGVLACAFTAWLASRSGLVDTEGHPIRLAPRLALYLPWLLWQIVLSNWDVIKRVWNPKLPISPRVIAVPCRLKSDLATSIYANSITLTPGTVTIEADPKKGELLIHCLTEAAGQDLAGMAMHDRVKRLEEP